ncbi:MAG: hypothetical protein ACOYMR_13725 [Ilumatobacteraceae bacterium]
MTNEQHLPEVTASYDRRGFFRIGGLTIAAGALIAACGDPAASAGEVGRVGTGATNPTLPDAKVDNSVLLRTSASIEQSIVDAYQHMLDGGLLAKPSTTFPDLGEQSDLVSTFLDSHRKAAESYNQLAQEAGGEQWDCGNPRLDSAFINPIFERVENGSAATDTAKEIAPSDDPTRDMVNLVVTLELLSAATAQALVPQVTEASFRAEAMRLAMRSSRQGALMSLKINPGAYVTSADAKAANPSASTTTTAAPTTTQNIAAPEGGTDSGETAAPPATEIPLPTAIPSQYGSLAPITYIGGAGDENGVRLKVNFETPSLNSFVYPFSTCD